MPAPGTMPAPGSIPAPGSWRPQAAAHQPEFVWLVLWLLCVGAIAAFPGWQVIPFDLIWVSLALLYGFRLWPGRRTAALIVTAVLTTAAVIGDDMVRHVRIGASVEQMPLLAAMFLMMAWQANRRSLARDRSQIAAEAQRMLDVQRQFLQDASHQLRTPITIALGHAELLADALAGRQRRDIDVVVGELERLKALSERLLLVAASENPDFLSPVPVDLGAIAAELVHRWQPTAARDWRFTEIKHAWAFADRERLDMALDALVENAVQHTHAGDKITVSVLGSDSDGFARIVVEDSGDGIAEHDMPHIFDRFRTIGTGSARGTGLGLALVQAIAHGHGGGVTARSTLGQGSSFELRIPAAREPISRAQHDESQEDLVRREAWCD